MEEAVKTRLILILSVLCAILFLGTIGSCSNSYRQKAARDKEMAARLDLEEKMSKHTQEKSGIESKLKAKEKELEEERVAHALTSKALAQEQLVSQSLKDELTKVIESNKELVKDKEALAGSKKTKK